MADKSTTTMDHDTTAEVSEGKEAPSPAPNFDMGTVVDGRFKLLKQLGVGGFGQVFLAHDQKRGEDLALKILQLKDMPPRQADFFISTFQQEFGSLTKLRHPNLCSVYDFGKLPGKNLYYFTSEYVSNAEDLMKATEKSSLEETIDLFMQLCRAVGYVHSHGLVHYDLKPANILVQIEKGRKQVKLVDFGLATPQRATLKATAGSLLYMSPEILMKERIANHRSDLYAIGVILFQILTRQHPFAEARTKDEVIQAHLKKTPPRLEEFRVDLEPFWQEIVDRLLTKRPEDRYSSATIVLKKIGLHRPETTEGTVETKEGILGYTFSSELITRGPLLEQLKEQIRCYLQEDAPHPPVALLLVGDKGTGKTRLLDEIKYHAQLAGHHVMHFDNPERFEQDLRRELDIPADDLETTLVLDDDPMSAVQGWVGIFLEKTLALPTLVLVDDLEQFSKKYQLFFERLVQAQNVATLAGNPLKLTLVATNRSTDLPALWIQSQSVKTITLENLTEGDVALYLKSFTGLETIPPALTKKFYQATSGNPFFLGEILKSLVEKNQLFEPSGLEFREDIPIPSSVSSVLKERFLKLPVAEKKLLTLLATTPHPLAEEVLEKLSSLPHNDTQEGLGQLSRLGFVEYHDNEARLTSLSMKQAIQETLSQEEWRQNHQQMAQWVGSIPNPDPSRIAYHLFESKDYAKATPYALETAERCRLSGNMEEETRALRWALKGLPDNDRRTRVAQRRLSQILGLEGEYQQADELIKKQMATPSTDDAEAARDLRTAGWLALKQKKNAEALDYFLKARARLNDRKHSFDTALLNDIGNIYLLTRRYAEAEKTFEESFASLQKKPLKHPNDLMNNKLAVAYNLLGKEKQSTQFLEEKKKLFKQNETGNSITLASVESELGYLLMRQGKYAKAVPHFESCLKISEERHFLHNIIKTLFNLTHCYEYQSLYAEAIQYAQKQLKYASLIGTTDDVAASALSVANLYVTLGVYTKAEPLFAKALQLYKDSKPMTGWTLISMAGFYSETGRLDEAQRAVLQASLLAKDLQDQGLSENVLYAVAEVAYARNDEKGCQEALERCESIIKNRQEGELWVRLSLVRLKLTLLSNKKMAEDQITPLESVGGLSLEIQIETSLTLAEYWRRQGSEKKAQDLLGKARKLYQELSGKLPEEYQDSFRQQKRFAGLFV